MRNGPEPIRLPPQVWADPEVLRLCRDHDAGGLFRLAKRHGVSNERIAYWIGTDAADVSRRVNGRTGPVTALHRWQAIADGLDMADPARLALGLAPRVAVVSPAAYPVPSQRAAPRVSKDDDMRRRIVLQAAVFGVVGAVAAVPAGTSGEQPGSGTPGAGMDGAGPGADLVEQGCAEWLAWQLWQRGRDAEPAVAVAAAELPPPLARYLDLVDHRRGIGAAGRRLSPGGTIVCQRGQVAFLDPAMVDVRLGQRMFRSIAAGSSQPLGAGQTSHATDLVIRELVQHNPGSVAGLTGWMTGHRDPLVGVNSAGILAKLGRADTVDQVVATLIGRADIRRLYVTAVLARVLGRPWTQAQVLAAGLDGVPSAWPASEGRAPDAAAFTPDAVGRLATELGNSRDGAARWCAAVALAHSGAAGRAPVRSALHRALQVEQSRQNLRAIGAVLSGASPVTG